MIIQNKVYLYTFIDDDSHGQGRIKVQQITRYSFEAQYGEEFIVYDLGDDLIETYAYEWEIFHVHGFRTVWAFERDDARAKDIFLKAAERTRERYSKEIENLNKALQDMIRFEQKLRVANIVEEK